MIGTKSSAVFRHLTLFLVFSLLNLCHPSPQSVSAQTPDPNPEKSNESRLSSKTTQPSHTGVEEAHSVEVETKTYPAGIHKKKFPWFWIAAGTVVLALAVAWLVLTRTTWPQYNDDPAIFTKFITDPANDLQVAPGGGPPAVIPYPPVDVLQISLGVKEGYFYVRLDLAGLIPESSQEILGQTVKKQCFNLGMDSDNNLATGTSDGSDIVFSSSIKYGFWGESPYAWCNFSSSGSDSGQTKISGERRSGGPDCNFMVYRYKIADLGTYFPAGNDVKLVSWSEAESSQYHHFAFDPVNTAFWTIPY